MTPSENIFAADMSEATEETRQLPVFGDDVSFTTAERAEQLAEQLWDNDSQEPQAVEPALLHPEDETADQIIGRQFSIYRCDALLGKGGMGRVYLAYHTQLSRPCALKITSPPKQEWGICVRTRTQEEARSAASLVHPNIVTIHALGELNGRHFIEMELVSGGSLKRILKNEGRFPVLQALRYLTAVAYGLNYSHRQGILHRDIKPENILICARGVPKLADFGLAHRVGRAEQTPAGQVCGTLPYMAPEMIRTGQFSPATDVYALGVTLFHILTGQLPYRGDNPGELIQEILSAPYPEPRSLRPDLPLEVAETIGTLMAREPENRPHDGTEAWHLLSSVLGQLRDVRSILEEALGHDKSVSWMRCENKYGLRVRLPEGRQQRVYMESSNHRPDEQLLMIYSVCCPATPDYYETALRLNAEFSHGGLAIREIEGVPHFVMINTYPRGTVDAEEVRKSVREIAEHADRVEFELTGMDHH